MELARAFKLRRRIDMSVEKTPYQDQKYIHVVQFLRPKNFDNTEIVYVRDDKAIVTDPLDATWFVTYDAAAKYRTYLQEHNVLDMYCPGTITVTTFAVHATLLGQQPTLKSKDWKPIIGHEDDMDKTAITGKAITDITDQTVTTTEYAISATGYPGGARRFFAEGAYGNFSTRLSEATHYQSFSEALDKVDILKKKNDCTDIQIHEIVNTVSVGRTVTA